MFREIMEEIRHVRSRLDEHISDETKQFDNIRQDIGRIREDMAGHKTIVGVITSGIAVFVAATISFIFRIFGKE